MADETKPTERPQRNTGLWVLFTIVLLLTMQTAPPLFVVFSRGLASGFDWAGFIGYSLGSIVVPLALGCFGLFWRKRPGLGFLLVSVTVFLALEAISIAMMDLS